MVTDEVLRALADPIRRSILELLSRSRRPVTEIASHFEVSRPAISRHLRVLRDAGAVSETRSGRERIYRIEPRALEEASAWLARLAAGRAIESETPTGAETDPAAKARPAREREPLERQEPSDWRQW